ncbi:MAG: ABC-ATPase domain-containing protein [Myxococcota bacterium]
MSLDTLRRKLWNLDGRGYPAYKSVRGKHGPLVIDRVQGDPFASPSRVRYFARNTVPWCGSTDQRRATSDFVLRALVRALGGRVSHRGSGKSGEIQIETPGQQVLDRSAVLVDQSGEVEVRVRVGLPAKGRRILGDAAAELLCDELPERVEETLAGLDAAAHRAHIECVEDSVALRKQLDERGLVAFVADGAILPRRGGNDDRPMREDPVRFETPAELASSINVPHRGVLRGMAVRSGVTLIVGGGYHGKSTLLTAIERGIYDHIPGDGREQVVSRLDTVKVRAEDGRAVRGVDISPFIGTLPGGKKTDAFETEDASGSTSQAASVIEALELGASALLIDEDTSATNFLIRDRRMAALVPAEREPITPLIDRLSYLRAQDCALVMVVGGTGDYFAAADQVIGMNSYRPEDLTDRARALAADFDRPSLPTPARAPHRRVDTVPSPRKIKVHALDRIRFGDEDLDLGALEQLVERGQTRALATLIQRLSDQELAETCRKIESALRSNGIASVQDSPDGDWASVRRFELAAAINRLRGARLSQGH